MESSEKAQQVLSNWLTDQLRFNNVPRLDDVWTYVQRQGWQLSRKQVIQTVRLHPAYKMNVRQQRMPSKSKMYRPVIVSELGHWHADIGFFSINSRYEMPINFRAGYLVAKDILSRKIYATPLIKNRTADSIIRAFEKLFKMHLEMFPNVRVQSISFDRETSVMSKKVQAFFKDKGISFHAFSMSSSKAKFAEGAIRQIREVMKRLMERGKKGDRWYNLLPIVIDILNNQEIIVDKKKLGFTPNQVNETNVKKFKQALYKAVPAYFISQFDISPKLVTFAYKIGDLVRAKLIATSSDVLGNKRSEINLTQEIYVIKELVPYVTRKMTLGKAYKCFDINNGNVEIFQEDELALSNTVGDDAPWKQDPTEEEI